MSDILLRRTKNYNKNKIPFGMPIFYSNNHDNKLVIGSEKGNVEINSLDFINITKETILQKWQSCYICNIKETNSLITLPPNNKINKGQIIIIKVIGHTNIDITSPDGYSIDGDENNIIGLSRNGCIQIISDGNKNSYILNF